MKDIAKGAGKATLATAKFAGKSTKIIIVWVLAICSCGILLPGAIATTRGCHKSVAIWLVNVLLFWSVIGWIAALIWAFVNDKEPLAVQIAKEQAKMSEQN